MKGKLHFTKNRLRGDNFQCIDLMSGVERGGGYFFFVLFGRRWPLESAPDKVLACTPRDVSRARRGQGHTMRPRAVQYVTTNKSQSQNKHKHKHNNCRRYTRQVAIVG